MRLKLGRSDRRHESQRVKEYGCVLLATTTTNTFSSHPVFKVIITKTMFMKRGRRGRNSRFGEAAENYKGRSRNVFYYQPLDGRRNLQSSAGYPKNTSMHSNALVEILREGTEKAVSRSSCP